MRLVVNESCAWCWKKLGKHSVETTNGTGGLLTFCDDSCRREYRSHTRLPGDPPQPPFHLQPEYGRYGEFDTCQWCWKPANKVGWLGGVKAPYKLPAHEPAGEPLAFCDEGCAQWWKQHRCSRSALASREAA